MPDDCGHSEDRYLRNLNKRVDTVEEFNRKAGAFLDYIPYTPYTRICPYCKTNPKKDTCVNCGAPQEPVSQSSRRSYDEYGCIVLLPPELKDQKMKK